MLASQRKSASDEQSEYLLRLYVAGIGPHSVRAQENLNQLCGRYLPDKHRLEVVDVLVEPKRALEDGVLVTPTLLKLAPGAKRMIVGDLSAEHDVLAALGIAHGS